MTFKFTPEDFLVDSQEDPLSMREFMAYRANVKLAEYLKTLPRLTGLREPEYNMWFFGQRPSDHDTHVCYSFGIEELKREPCKHEPIVEKKRQMSSIFPEYEQTIPKCKHCGVALKAEWKEVE